MILLTSSVYNRQEISPARCCLEHVNQISELHTVGTVTRALSPGEQHLYLVPGQPPGLSVWFLSRSTASIIGWFSDKFSLSCMIRGWLLILIDTCDSSGHLFRGLYIMHFDRCSPPSPLRSKFFPHRTTYVHRFGGRVIILHRLYNLKFFYLICWRSFCLKFYSHI